MVDVAGKPLIYHTITAAVKSNIDETWLSSENDEILKVAEQCGAKTIRRPVEFATDEASTASVMMHFASQVDFDVIVLIQATSPMTTADDLNKGLAMLHDYDTVISASELTQFVWREGVPNYDPANRKRRQDLAPTFLETGAFFIMTRENLMKYKTQVGGKVGMCKVPKIRSFDVDSYEDLEVIRRLMT